MYGTCFTFGNLSSGKNITTRYFLIDSVKSEEVLIELSDDCYCNLCVLNTEQTDFSYKICTLFSLYAWHVFDIWKTFCQETIRTRYFLIDCVKSVEVVIELSEDCYCNLSLLNTEQTDFSYKVKKKSVQSTLNHLQSPPEQTQSQRNCLFLVKITSSWHDLIHNACPKSPKK